MGPSSSPYWAMTFSIVAALGPRCGVAVASKFLAVGNTVPAVGPFGAVATQAAAKVSFKPDLLALLAQGVPVHQALAKVLAADPGSDDRQVGVVALGGGDDGGAGAGGGAAASHTGAGCYPWAGGVTGVAADGAVYAIQGNVLAGPQVVAAVEAAFCAAAAESGSDAEPEAGWDEEPGAAGAAFVRRLVAALLAGDRAGGDRRGRQSAAVLAHEEGSGYDGSGVLADLRVDDHTDPVPELARLVDLSELYFGRPEGVQPLTGELLTEVAARLRALGHEVSAEPALHPDRPDPAVVDLALGAWAGMENLETRLVPGGIDARVLTALRAATPAPADG